MATPAREADRRRRQRAYLLLLLLVVVLLVSVRLSYEEEFYHSPRRTTSPRGDLFLYDTVFVGDKSSRVVIQPAGGPAAGPSRSFPLPGAVILAADGGDLVIGAGQVSFRGESVVWAKPLGIEAEPLAAIPEAGGAVRFFGPDTTEGRTLLTWVVSWDDLARPESAGPAPAPVQVDIVGRGPAVEPDAWPFVLDGRVHVAWRPDASGRVTLSRRDADGWEEAGTDEVGPAGAVFGASGRAWIVEPARQIGGFGTLHLRLRPFGGGGPQEAAFPEFRLFGKRVSGIAADPRDGGVDFYVTRTGTVQRARLGLEDGTWDSTGDLETLRRRPPWQTISNLFVVPVFLAAFIPMMAIGARLYRDRRLAFYRLFKIPMSHPLFAGVGERTMAYAIDLTVVAPLVILASAIVEYEPAQDSGLPAAEYLFSAAAITAIHILYFLPLEWLAGQTLGKRIIGIRVQTPDGARPGFFRSIVRNLLRLPDAYFVVGVVLILLTRRRQRIGDLLARTVVVSAEPPPEPSREAPPAE